MVSANLRQMAFCTLSVLLVPCAAQGQFYFPSQSATADTSPAAQQYTQLAPTTPVNHAAGQNYFAPTQNPRLSMQTDPAGPLPAPAEAPDDATAENDAMAENGLEPAPAPYGTTAGCDHGPDCTTCEPVCVTPRCSPWYASVSGLVMGRNKPNGVWTTYETNNNPNQLMNTRDTDPDWQGGGDLRIGRFFGCSRWALEFGYWGIGNFDNTQSMTNPNTVSTPLLFQDLEFGAGNPVQDWFDAADEHRLTRRNKLYNFELNIIQGYGQGYGTAASCQRFTGRALLGIRYFQFDEDLILETLDQGGTWGGNGGLDQATMDSSVENTMIGAQIGYLLEYRFAARGSAFIAPKIGLYNNHIKNSYNLYRGDGTAATPTAFSGVAGGYPVNSSKDIASFLSEVDLGLRFQLSQHWSLFGGYRVVVINGVGLADDQIPQYVVDIPEIAAVDTNGSLILHGAFFGVGLNF